MVVAAAYCICRFVILLCSEFGDWGFISRLSPCPLFLTPGGKRGGGQLAWLASAAAAEITDRRFVSFYPAPARLAILVVLPDYRNQIFGLARHFCLVFANLVLILI